MPVGFGRREFFVSALIVGALSFCGANAKGWTVVDMKRDWNKVFAFQQ